LSRENDHGAHGRRGESLRQTLQLGVGELGEGIGLGGVDTEAQGRFHGPTESAVQED
jgi:hypothetical protein